MKTPRNSKWFWLMLSLTLLGIPFFAPTVQADPVSGVVVDCKGNPISGALVTIYKVEGSSETPIGRATSNATGVFEFNPISKGTYNVLALCPDGSRAVSVNFQVPGTASHVLRLVCCPQSSSRAQSQSSSTFKSDVKMAQGLHRATFDSIHGRVIVNMPDDLRAGDTISGTVVVEPKGSTEEERNNNAAKLSELKLNLGAKFPKDQKELLIMVTPRLISHFTADIPESFDYTIGVNVPRTDKETVTITINSPIWFIRDQATPSDFRLPPMGQQGRLVEIFGPFDGNFSNTTLRFGPPGSTVQDFEKNTENVSGGFGLIRPLAESPGKLVYEAPTNVTGPIELNLKEGNAQSAGVYRNVGVRLSAPKTNLLKGERTILTTEVIGLQGIKEPVPLTLDAKGVITMEGGSFQPLFIQPSQVSSDGRYTTTRGITGIQSGGWEATATVVTQPFNIVLRDPNPPQTFLLNSFTGNYIFCGKGSKLTGTGQVQMKGCILTLTHNAPDRRVFGRLDACTPVDNARYFTFYTPGTNMDIVVDVTDTKPTRTRLYFNPLNRPTPPVQDVSAFATCP